MSGLPADGSPQARSASTAQPGPAGLAPGTGLLGLTGADGTARQAVAVALARSGWCGIGFADALRIEAADAWSTDLRVFTDRSARDRPVPQLRAGQCLRPAFLRWCAVQGLSLYAPRSPRWVLQSWDAWRRDADPDCWVRQVAQWIHDRRDHGRQRLLVTDIRTDTETAMLHALGGLLLRVHRLDLAAAPRSTATHADPPQHRPRSDADLHDDGSPQHLDAELARVLQTLAARDPLHPRHTTGASRHG